VIYSVDVTDARSFAQPASSTANLWLLDPDSRQDNTKYFSAVAITDSQRTRWQHANLKPELPIGTA